jgi:hypothetical protein
MEKLSTNQQVYKRKRMDLEGHRTSSLRAMVIILLMEDRRILLSTRTMLTMLVTMVRLHMLIITTIFKDHMELHQVTITITIVMRTIPQVTLILILSFAVILLKTEMKILPEVILNA